MTFPVLALMGPAGSGKDTFADWLVLNKGFCKIACADPMKRFVKGAFGLDSKQLWGDSDNRNQVFPVNDEWWFNVYVKLYSAAAELLNYVITDKNRKYDAFLKLHSWVEGLRENFEKNISARVILQTLGTEWGRSLDSQMWVRYAYECAEQISHGKQYTKTSGLLNFFSIKAEGVVIADYRFENELTYSLEHGGKVIRICRPAMEKKSVGISGHSSEKEQERLSDSLFSAILNVNEFNLPAEDYLYRTQMELCWREKPWDTPRSEGRTVVFHIQRHS